MFNRSLNIHAPQTGHTTVTKTIHEHRAPTDESVRLLKEMEEAARDKIEQSIHVSDNGFDCVVHFLRNPIDSTIILKAVFTLNGERMTAEIREPTFRYEKSEAVKMLRDEMAKEIAIKLLTPALRQLMTTTTFGIR